MQGPMIIREESVGVMPCPETAMKMKTLIGYMLLILCVWTPLHLSVAQTIDTKAGAWDWWLCGNTKYIDGGDFQRNVIQVLESLAGNASTSGFNTSSVKGQNSNSTVYGFVQCRGDLNSSDCKAFASAAEKTLLEKCNSTSGFIQTEGCFFRYDNHNFYNDYNGSSKFKKLCNNIQENEPDLFANITVKALSKLIERAVPSYPRFAIGKFETDYPDMKEIYSIVQCWYLSPANCRSCLTAGQSIISGPGRSNVSTQGCESGAIGARYMSPNCFLRYEIYPFFNTSIMPSPPVSRPNVLGITLGVLAATVGLMAVIGLWKWNFFSRRRPWECISRTRGQGGEIDLSPIIPNPELIFEYDILREAASHFNEENKLGQGGFGSVFKGVLPDSREVAIKRLNKDSRQGDTEFLNETNLISRVQHKNLVKLLGCSVKSSERLLVYEYLQNGSLDNILFDRTKSHLLDWRTRYEIIVGTARGLAYLHEESVIRIVHRDIKASNILLDNKYRPKIADFGLAKLFGEDQSHVSTRIAGTLGYMAPEYALRGQLTEKADVFSFGVLVLEIISGRKNQSLLQHIEFLLEQTWRLYKEGGELEVMDPTLEGSYSCEEAMRVIKIGLLCTQGAAALRPSMSVVVSMLTSEREYVSSPTRPAFIDVDNAANSHQLQRPRSVVDRDKASSSTAISPNAHPNSHSGAVVSSPGTLEPRAKLNGTVGSPFYIAPDVFSGGYNQAADVWSAGVILYILLSGIPPFWSKTKSKILDAVTEAKLQFPKDNWGGISSSAKDLISRMLCTNLKKRLTSMGVLEHPWITGQVELSRHSSNGVKGKQCITCNSLSSREPKTMASFSSAFDYNNKTNILSSFSGFIVTDNGCQVLGSFAFNPKTNGSEYSSTIQNTLSFAFANIDGTLNSEHSVSFSDNKMQHQLSQRGSSFGHLFAAAVSNSIKSVSQYVMSVEEGGGQTQKAEASNTRYLITHRENHTIGLGEFEQLDLKVSESIIRWASCTRLSGCTSFQSPLVC